MTQTLPKTHWIWIPDVEEKVMDRVRIVFFRKNFFIRESGKAYRIKISADTRYKLYINGTFAQFGPARGDHRIWYYDEFEITPYLNLGENVIAVEVLRYPVGYAAGNYGMFRTTTPGLFVEVTCQTDAQHCAETAGEETGRNLSRSQNGQEWILVTDSSWRCRERAGYQVIREAEGFAPLMYMEDCYGEEETKNWKLQQYDDSRWAHAFAYHVMEVKEAAVPADLHERPIPFLYLEKKCLEGTVPRYEAAVCEEWDAFVAGGHPIAIPAHAEVSVELNAGELVCGYLSLRVLGGAGACVRILQSEGYVQHDRSINGIGQRKEDRLDWENGYLEGYADTYHVAGYGKTVPAKQVAESLKNGNDTTKACEEIYEPYWFRTFRFLRLEIRTADEPLTLTGLDYLKTGYPLDVKSHIETSDESLGGVWDISLRSLRLCMQETYIDCPFYEQLQYAMDARNEILYTYMVSADDRLARQCMDDFRRSQREDGMINCCYPNYGPNVIPGFSIYYILMVYDHMMYFGDKRLVRKHLPCIDAILGYFDEHLDSRGLVGKTGGHISERYWSFIDWALPWGESVGMPPAGYKGPLTMESLLYIMGLQHAAKLCEYVGRESTAQEYLQRARAVQTAINTFCRDSDGVYLDGPGVSEYSQHCQIFAILTDTAESQNYERLLQKTLDEPEKYAQHTVASAFYLFRAMEKAGIYNQTESLWDVWREMLRKHLTTCVENQTDERSDCHGWGALILYEMPAVILGVRPAAPGFEKIKIAPVPGYLDWAKGTVATKWGTISVEWKKTEDGSLDLKYEVPEVAKHRVEQ